MRRFGETALGNIAFPAGGRDAACFGPSCLSGVMT